MEAVQVSQQVGQGITLQKDNILLLIDAWERLGYDLVDEQWREIYDEATKRYDAPSRVAERATAERVAPREANIGEMASLIKDERRTRISEQAKSMRQKVEKDVQAIIAANSSITRLLHSANSVGQTRGLVISRIEELLSITIRDISTIITDATQPEGSNP
jgi:coenzyme F420-reducing hydrogenase alpha subunit